MTNKQIAKQFQLLAKILELNGENKFKVRSYQNAYNALRGASVELVTASDEQIAALPGVGKTIASKLIEVQQTGTFEALEQARASVSAGIIELFGVSGLGPKKIALLRDELDIQSPGELLYACNENRLVELKGFGAKSQENIRKQVSYFMEGQDKLLLHQADAIAAIVEDLFNRAGVSYNWVGDYAKDCAVIDRMEILIRKEDEQRLAEITDVSIDAESLSITSGDSTFKIAYYSASMDMFANQLVQLTRGAWLTPEIEAKLKAIKAESEKDVFAQLGMPYLAPALRDLEGLKESPEQLIEFTDVKGLIHAHSTWSDGANTIIEMAAASKALGHEYMVITDHSKSAFYANGLDEDRVYAQHNEVEKLNNDLTDYHVFKGIESDILRNGDLDYPEEVLSSFDVVIASVHSVLNMSQEDATERLIKAIENPHTRILGHPTGRLLLSRPGYPIDHTKVIEACAANNVAIELNANPHRLDIDWRWIRQAVDLGVLISINPDAHSITGIEDIKYGVRVARKAALQRQSCLSAFGIDGFKKWLAAK